MDLLNLIDNYGASHKDRIAHKFRDSEMTYGELALMSDALASYIIEEYKHDKTPIVVYGHKQHEMLVCFLACVKSGHAYVPIDSSLPKERINDIIEGSKANLILSVGQLAIKPQDVGIRNNHEIAEIIISYKDKKPEKAYRVKPEDTYYIIYTSGSTGKPKGVQITLSCLQSFISWGMEICNLNHDKNYTFMNQAPFSFDLSVMDLYISLATGSTLFSIDKEMIGDLKQLFQTFKSSGIGVWVSTPSFAEMCLADKSFNEDLLPDLELLLFCGEVLSNGCVKKLYERFNNIRVVNTYGPTEATVAVTSIDVDIQTNERFEPLPVGRVKDDCSIIIVDSSGGEVPVGEKGEIVIAGESVSPGYYRNQEITEKVFSKMVVNGALKRSYKTGDEGYIKDGFLYFCGRIDFQIKLNGFRIELEDIENNLRKIDFIDSAVVIPVNKNGRIQYLAAVVTLNRTIEEREFKIGLMIKEELKEFLPEYMIPRKIVIKDSLPMNVNGKINRRELMEGMI